MNSVAYPENDSNPGNVPGNRVLPPASITGGEMILAGDRPVTRDPGTSSARPTAGRLYTCSMPFSHCFTTVISFALTIGLLR